MRRSELNIIDISGQRIYTHSLEYLTMGVEHISDESGKEWEEHEAREGVDVKWLMQIEDGPRSKIAKFQPGEVVEAHYHKADQWQIILEGSCKFNEKEVEAIGVQYVEAGTTYGPITVGENGVTILLLRAEPGEAIHHS
jgi:quercetin dioxygenase-like cupin family protein